MSLTVVSCGVPKEDYEALVAERDTILAERDAMQTQVEALQRELDKADSRIEAIEGDLLTEQTQVLFLQSDYDQAKTDLAVAKARYIAIKSELDTLRMDYDAVSTELSGIKMVYPPSYFSSEKELEDWLKNNDVSEKGQPTNIADEYEMALELQEDALRDGYVVSVNYIPQEGAGYGISCVALVGDTLLKFVPWMDVIMSSMPVP